MRTKHRLKEKLRPYGEVMPRGDASVMEGRHMQLVRYDAMCRAIADAYDVDEVKGIRDKAIAMEAYFRQAKNPEPERRACEIRLRAERKAGKLLGEMEKHTGGRPEKTGSAVRPVSREHFDSEATWTPGLENTPTLSELGVSKTQSARWQQLAGVPEEDFEAALAAPEKPSTNGIIQSRPKQEAMDAKALWLWGRLRDFGRDGILDEDARALLSRMTDGMRADCLRLSAIGADCLKGADDGCEDAMSNLHAEGC